MTKVAIIGTGYVGLTTGACFSDMGHEVICADIDTLKIARLQRGHIPILEHGIDQLVATGIEGSGLDESRLAFTDSPADACLDAEIVFLCVPTPTTDDGSADLTYIEAAVRTIASSLPSTSVLVTKSTVPVGSTTFIEHILEQVTGFSIPVVSNPEFLREGNAVYDFMNPDRIIIGSAYPLAARRVGALYESLDAPILYTDPVTAELIKYAANGFLATKLSFVNAIAAVCEAVEADIQDVLTGLSYDHRIGPAYLQPGPGWGGSCFPKDTRALLKMSKSAGYPFRFLQGVLDTNDEQIDRIMDKLDAVTELWGHNPVAIWGLTFKAGTDDLRDSPALKLIDTLRRRNFISAWDPTVQVGNAHIPDEVKICTDPYEACIDASALVVLTEWPEIVALDPHIVAGLMKDLAVIDTRNILDRNDWEQAGFRYQGNGR